MSIRCMTVPPRMNPSGLASFGSTTWTISVADSDTRFGVMATSYAQGGQDGRDGRDGRDGQDGRDDVTARLLASQPRRTASVATAGPFRSGLLGFAIELDEVGAIGCFPEEPPAEIVR